MFNELILGLLESCGISFSLLIEKTRRATKLLTEPQACNTAI